MQLIKEKRGPMTNLPCSGDASPCTRHPGLHGEVEALPGPDLLGLLQTGEEAPIVTDRKGHLEDGAENACI